MLEKLDMKFCDSMPYTDLNAFNLNDELRNCWKEFALYVGSLCEREKDLELLDEQYPNIYDESLSILQSYYP